MSNVSQVYKNFEKATKYKNFKETYNLIKKRSGTKSSTKSTMLKLKQFNGYPTLSSALLQMQKTKWDKKKPSESFTFIPSSLRKKDARGY